MKKLHLKLEFLTFLIIFALSYSHICLAEVVWSDNFDDGNLHGWSGVSGQLSAKNGSLYSTASGMITPDLELLSGAYHPSTVAVGTWSFDFLLNSSDAPEIAVEFISLGQYKWEIGEGNTQCYGFYTGWFHDGKYEFYKDIQFPGRTALEKFFSPSYTISNEWRHVDITRDEDGRIVIWVDGELVFDVVDKQYKECKYFGVHLEYSERGNSYIDNIVVSDTVDIEPPPPTSKGSTQIPGFPLESIIVALIMGTFVLRRIQQSR